MMARAALLAATVAAMACQGTATQTSPIFITDVLTGTVATGAPGFNIVKTNLTSQVTLALADLTPNPGVSVGVGLGSPPGTPGGDCSVQVFQTLKVGESYQISAVPSSTFCISVFEFIVNGVGAIPDPLSYTVKFNHH
jgi:hypothetical protein